MLPECDTIREIVAALSDRVLAAEQRASKAEIQRDQLRTLLTRVRTSLAEATSLHEVGG